MNFYDYVSSLCQGNSLSSKPIDKSLVVNTSDIIHCTRPKITTYHQCIFPEDLPYPFH